MKVELRKKLNRFKARDHIGFIYSNEEEKANIASLFMEIGLSRGEKCFYIAKNTEAKARIIDIFNGNGIDTGTEMTKGNLNIATCEETYLKDDDFDPSKCIEKIKGLYEAAKEDGYAAVRTVSEMGWAVDCLEKLVEYEMKVNSIFDDNDIVSICQYDLNQFPTEIIRDVIFAHPYIIYKNFERFFNYRH
jgi:hypothetical protein